MTIDPRQFSSFASSSIPARAREISPRALSLAPGQILAVAASTLMRQADGSFLLDLSHGGDRVALQLAGDNRLDLSFSAGPAYTLAADPAEPLHVRAKTAAQVRLGPGVEPLVDLRLPAPRSQTVSVAAPAPALRRPLTAVQAKMQVQMAGQLAQGRLRHDEASSVRELSQRLGQIQKLLDGSGAGSVVPESFRRLVSLLNEPRRLGLPPQAGLAAVLAVPGRAGQVEGDLHSMLSAARPGSGVEPMPQALLPADAQKLLAELLAAVQGRPGQPPLGYPAEAFAAPAPSDVRPSIGSPLQRQAPVPPVAGQSLVSTAQQLAQGGALGGAAPSTQPSESGPSAEAQAAASEKIAKTGGDEAIKLAKDGSFVAGLTPAQKAELFKKLPKGGGMYDSKDQLHGGAAEAAQSLLGSCKTKAEYDEVLNLLGGKDSVFKSIGFDKVRDELKKRADEWQKAQDGGQEKAISLLEQASSPEEVQQIVNQLGGTQFKNQVKVPALLDRLEAVSKRFNLPALGYGMSGEAVDGLRRQLANAKDEDIGKTAENKDAMAIASPAEKAALIRKAFATDNITHNPAPTTPGGCAAIYKVLASCTSKAEYDEVLRLAGTKDLFFAVSDKDEWRHKMDELAGAWGRADAANDPERAKKFDGVMANPELQAQLGATRPPTAEEAKIPGGSFDLGSKGQSDPLLAQAGQVMSQVKADIGKKAFDLGYEPQARTELVLEQRRREIDGKPKLDWTQLTAEAEKISNDPELAKLGKDDRQNAINDKMKALAEKNGLSEQTMKSLVTQRLGQVYNEAAGQMGAYGAQTLDTMKKQLAELERKRGDSGPVTPEEKALRERIDQFEKLTGPYTKSLGETGDIYTSMFPSPKDGWSQFYQLFSGLLSMFGDMAAGLLSCVPGLGQAIGGCYFAVKAGVAASHGDVWGALGGVASAIPGLGGALGGSSLSLNVTSRAMQAGIGVSKAISENDIRGALGSLANAAGGLRGADGALGQVAGKVEDGLKVGIQAVDVGEGIYRKNLDQTLSGLNGVFGGIGAMAAPGSTLAKVMHYGQNAVRMSGAIAHGQLSAAITEGSGIAVGIASPFIQNPVVVQVLEHASHAAPIIDALVRGDYGKALNVTADELESLPLSPAVRKALGIVADGLRVADGIRSGNYGKALTELAHGLGQFSSDPTFQRVVQTLSQGGDLIRAIQNRDPAAAVSAVAGKGGILEGLGGEAFAKSLGDVRQAAGKLLDSSSFDSVLDLTRTGTRLIQGIASGDASKALGAVAGLSEPLSRAVPQLQGAIQTVAPLAQSLLNGDYGKAVGDLASSPLTRTLADKLGVLQPLSDLAKGSALRDIEQLGGTLATVAQGAVSGDKTAVLDGIDRVLSQVQSAAGPDSAAGKILGLAQQAEKLTGGLLQGDLGRAMSAAGDLVKSQPELQRFAPVLDSLGKAVPFVQALERGDVSSALGNVSEALEGQAGNPVARKAGALVSDGLRFVEGVRGGEWARALGGLADGLGELGAGPGASRLAEGIGAVSGALGALGAGDHVTAAQTLLGEDGRGGALGALASGALSEGFNGLAGEARDLLGSPELGRVADLTRAGTRFVSALRSGDLSRTLNQVAGLSVPLGRGALRLQELLKPGSQLLAWMGRGEFGGLMQRLRGDSRTQELAGGLEGLEAVESLVRSDAMRHEEELRQGLEAVAAVPGVGERFEPIERLAAQLQELYASDPLGTARQLLSAAA
jgi:hypothetical protein